MWDCSDSEVLGCTMMRFTPDTSVSTQPQGRWSFGKYVAHAAPLIFGA